MVVFLVMEFSSSECLAVWIASTLSASGIELDDGYHPAFSKTEVEERETQDFATGIIGSLNATE